MVGDASVEYRKDDGDGVEISTDCSFCCRTNCLSVVLELADGADDVVAAYVADSRHQQSSGHRLDEESLTYMVLAKRAQKSMIGLMFVFQLLERNCGLLLSFLKCYF